MTLLRLCGALLLTVAVAACGSSGSSSSASSAPGAASHTTSAAASAAPAAHGGAVKVAIKGYAFDPATITVAPGTKITFTNGDQTAHTATSTKTAFDTGTVAPGASKSITVHAPGTYAYYCQFHAFMKATIVVR